MPAKRFAVEQIIAKLREAEKLQAEGLTIPQTCKRLQISDQTFYRWRLKYGALGDHVGDPARRVGTAWVISWLRSGPSSKKKRSRVASSRPSAAQTSRLRLWSTTTTR